MAPADPDERARLLDSRLAAIRAREAGTQVADRKSADDYRAGNRVLADLLGGVLGGLFLGMVIDQFGTRPWGLLVMMFLGIFVAFRNILKHSQGSGAAIAAEHADDELDPHGQAGACIDGTEGRD